MKRSFVAICLIAFFAGAGFAYEPPPLDIIKELKRTYTDRQIEIVEGELMTITAENVQKVSVSDPDVVDIVSAEADEVVLIGKSDGQAYLFIWDDKGKNKTLVRVTLEDISGFADRIQGLLNDAGLDGITAKANNEERKVILTGTYNLERQDMLDQIALEYDGRLMIFVSPEKQKDLVQVDLQITELNETFFRNLGIEWLTTSDSFQNFGAGDGVDVREIQVFNNDRFSLPFVEGTGLDDFNRAERLTARINAIIEEGNGRILSEPKLVVKSGEEASFLVGGEIPIRRTTETTTGATQEDIEFKQYGVGVTLLPLVVGHQVDIDLYLEISDLDPANANVQGDVAFTTRTAQTRLLLDDNETIVLAGMIRTSNNEIKRRVPVLGKIPVLGMMFRNRKTPISDQDTELVMSLTPHIIRKQLPVQPRTVDVQPVKHVVHKVVEVQPPVPIQVYQQPIHVHFVEPTNFETYVHYLQNHIASSVVYPIESRNKGEQGTVKVNMVITEKGDLAFAFVEDSSGFDHLDESALKLVNSLTYPPFPPNMEDPEINISVPIVYQLN